MNALIWKTQCDKRQKNTKNFRAERLKIFPAIHCSPIYTVCCYMYILHTLFVYYRPDKYFIIKLQNANGRLKNYFHLMLLRFAVYRWLLALASLLFFVFHFTTSIYNIWAWQSNYLHNCRAGAATANEQEGTEWLGAGTSQARGRCRGRGRGITLATNFACCLLPIALAI